MLTALRIQRGGELLLLPLSRNQRWSGVESPSHTCRRLRYTERLLGLAFLTSRPDVVERCSLGSHRLSLMQGEHLPSVATGLVVLQPCHKRGLKVCLHLMPLHEVRRSQQSSCTAECARARRTPPARRRYCYQLKPGCWFDVSSMPEHA